MKTKEKRFSNRNKKAMFAEIGASTALRRRSRFCYPHAGGVRNVGHKYDQKLAAEEAWRSRAENF
jgi:hypothetical protein